ncbi:MAG: hypothetical protein OEY34_08890, partial [Cyclobacteriaceae bacterium]|nr:hypothetical protein [Cyclobacteriaceae bacterium]
KELQDLEEGAEKRNINPDYLDRYVSEDTVVSEEDEYYDEDYVTEQLENEDANITIINNYGTTYFRDLDDVYWSNPVLYRNTIFDPFYRVTQEFTILIPTGDIAEYIMIHFIMTHGATDTEEVGDIPLLTAGAGVAMDITDGTTHGDIMIHGDGMTLGDGVDTIPIIPTIIIITVPIEIMPTTEIIM